MKLYNSLTRKAEEIPQDGPITLYTCGPTVYNYAHIGNFRSYLFADSIYRSLKFEGRDVRWVMNITDVDDKTIKGTLKEYGENATVATLRKYTDKYLDIFLDELNELNIDTQNIEIIRVADSIVEIQELVIELLNKGYAYKTEDGVFFNIEKYQSDFGDYGELVGKGFLEGKKVGARVKVDEYEKDNLSDFALWKSHSSEDGEIFWDHPVLGKGRPGWHIECSAINLKAFGKNTTTIHTGGVGLVFPHHTNEIAQSQPLYRPFVKVWAHCEHLQIDGKKMAKRDGNVYTLSDITAKHDPLAYRYLCLQTDFRKQMNFTWESLEAVNQALTRLKNQASKLKEAPATELSVEGRHLAYEFSESLSEDLNLPKALSVVWKTLDSVITDSEKLALLEKFDQVLGLDLLKLEDAEIPSKVSELLLIREKARSEKDFAESDKLREEITVLGYEVLDTSEGQVVKKDSEINMDIKLFVAMKAFIAFDNKILLIRESVKYSDGTNEGKYDVVGGRIEAGQRFDESLIREIKEETGLEAQIGSPFFINEWRPKVRDEQWQIVGTFLECFVNTNNVTLSQDHDEYVWINAEDYQQYDLIENLIPAFEAYIQNKNGR